MAVCDNKHWIQSRTMKMMYDLAEMHKWSLDYVYG